MMMAGVGGFHSQAQAQRLNDPRASFQTRIEYCPDTQANLSIQQVVDCRFLSRDDLSSGKLSDATYWIRLQVHQGQTKAAGLVIRIGPHFLKNIQLYQKTAKGWSTQVAGSEIPFNQANATIAGYVFEVQTGNENPETLYIRIQNTGLGLALISVGELSARGVDALGQELSIGIHIGALSLILLISIFYYLLNRDVLLYRFSWLMLVILLNIVGGSGLLAKYVFDEQPWFNGAFFVTLICLRLACWIWVLQAFLKAYPTPRWYSTGCRLVYWIVALSVVLGWFNQIVLVQQLLFTGFIATSIFQIIAIQKTPGMDVALRRTLLAGFIIANVLIFLTVILAIYPFAVTHTIVYVTRLSDFVTPMVLLVTFALSDRLKRKEFEAVKAANIQMNAHLEFERKLLKERRVLFDMLTHELKNPLASISLAVGSLKKHFTDDQTQEQRRIKNIDRSVRNMDLIIERCSLMNQVDQNEIKPNIREIDIGNLIHALVSEREDADRFMVSVERRFKVRGDDYFLTIIISNLLENAIKYAPADSKIEIVVRSVKGDAFPTLQLTIINQIGLHGVPDPDLVFTRFYRNPLAKNITGSGLGLHLVSELCKILHFTVRCEVGENEVSFLVELPEHVG